MNRKPKQYMAEESTENEFSELENNKESELKFRV